MDQKTVLLDQLRIDRSKIAQKPTRGPRLWWLIGVGAAATFVATWVAIWAPAADSYPIRAIIAKAVPLTSRLPAGSPLLDASGYVVALREAVVSAKGIYKVDEVLVQEGQSVRQGEIMARLDDTNVRASLEESRAQAQQLKAALAAAVLAAEDARPTFLRYQKQLAEGLISQDTFDTSKAAFDATQTAVTVAEANLAVAKAAAVVHQRSEDDTVIKAPFDGVVTVKTAQPGEIVSPQFSGGGGIVKIVDMNSLEVDVDVSENYINRVQPKQAASVTLNAYPDWQIPAEVIAVIPTADSAKATVKVRIGFKQKDSRIVPEMGAHVSFLDGAPLVKLGATFPNPGVVIPSEALETDADAGIVYVINGDHIERRSVRLGARNADGQTILAGLRPGTSLAVGDLSKLRDGLKIRIIP